MIWFDHSRDVPAGAHALLSASKYHWLNYDEEKLLNMMTSQYATTIGSLIHELAAKLITTQIRVNKNDAKKMVKLYLLDHGVPRFAIDLDRYINNFVAYVNDGIGFSMRPEQVLKYSNNIFGTADAISYDEKAKVLRIHDLKTGVTNPSIKQLEIYASLFTLEYNIKPADLKRVELRIYYMGEVLTETLEGNEIVPVLEEIRDKMVSFDSFITALKEQ